MVEFAPPASVPAPHEASAQVSVVTMASPPVPYCFAVHITASAMPEPTAVTTEASLPVIAATSAVSAAPAPAPPDTSTRIRPAVTAPGAAAVSNSYTSVPMVTVSPSETPPAKVSVPVACVVPTSTEIFIPAIFDMASPFYRPWALLLRDKRPHINHTVEVRRAARPLNVVREE